MLRDSNGKFCKLNQHIIAGELFDYVYKYIKQFNPKKFQTGTHLHRFGNYQIKFDMTICVGFPRHVQIKFDSFNRIVFSFHDSYYPVETTVEIYSWLMLQNSITKVRR